MRPLTVLQVAYPFATVGADAVGGAEQVLFALDLELTRRGHRSLVIAEAGSEVAGTLIALPRREGPLDEDARAQVRGQLRAYVEQVLDGWGIDLVHYHGIDFPAYRARRPTPPVATLHLPPAWYPEEALADPDLTLVCVSEAQRARCAGPATVVRNGVPVSRLQARHAKRGFALVLSRVCEEKGLHLALDAARAAEMSMLIGGRVFDYPAHRRYFQETLRPRLDARRRFLGPVGFARKRRLLTAARCLVVPSLVEETCCLAAWEALACGTPVVGFRRGALPEAVEHGRTGYLVDHPDELPAAMQAAAALDPQACRAAAREASLEAMADGYLALYRRILQGRGRVAA